MISYMVFLKINVNIISKNANDESGFSRFFDVCGCKCRIANKTMLLKIKTSFSGQYKKY
jgi:hypothetical protein